jgi:drug/metabolite transporter (DMT)-like permease
MGVLAFAGVAGTGFGSLLYIYAIQEAGAGRTAVLSALSPLFALPLSAIFLKEPITRWVAVGTVIAVAGILLLSV